MFPWLFLWCPQVNFPLSGEVRQRFSPAIFFESIAPPTGEGTTEAKIFNEVASYGKQLGILNDLVLSMCERGAVSEHDATHALEQLKSIRVRIEVLKKELKGQGGCPPQGTP